MGARTLQRGSGGPRRPPRPRTRFPAWGWAAGALLALAVAGLVVISGRGRPERAGERDDAPHRAETGDTLGSERAGGTTAARAPAEPARPAAVAVDTFKPRAPAVALVIDDWGFFENQVTRALLELDAPLTLAVLPGQRHSRRFAALADSARREVILHLPMQPEGYPAVDPGAHAIMVGMPAAEIERLLAEALVSVPGARGVSNHMGSAATADTTTMERLMASLAERGLYFLDSLTTPRSAAGVVAARHAVPLLRNRIFLDEGQPSREIVTARLETLRQAALRRGAAVGIGHPYPETVAALAHVLPRWREAGIRLVTLSELLQPPPRAALAAGPAGLTRIQTGALGSLDTTRGGAR